MQTARNLHRHTVALVRASAEAEAAQRILPLLDGEEQDVYRHGRNAKPKSVPRSSSVAEYAQATALEALFGWLYLKQRYGRINELFGVIAEGFSEKSAPYFCTGRFYIVKKYQKDRVTEYPR